MRRTTSLRALALTFGLASLFAACSGDKNNGGQDAGTGTEDAAAPDAEPVDSGPTHCLRDQGGAAVRGCDPGEVCNLAMNPPACVPGVACNTNADCNDCAALQNPDDCGHGFNVTAYCDTRHAAPGSAMMGTCTRSRAPCEPCESAADCGRLDPALGGTASQCLDYPEGKFCGRSCAGGCPDGFLCDSATQQCKSAGACEAVTAICPAKGANETCLGTDQSCPGTICPDTGGRTCTTNNVPGAIGTCIAVCETNDDCPSTAPVCSRAGVCIPGCTKGSCAGNKTCQLNGFCEDPCENNTNCTERFGENAYCNRPGQPPPRYYKPYHDDNSCRALGCEDEVDCAVPGVVCDNTMPVRACVPGCYEEDDCAAGFVCKSTSGAMPQSNYSREECRALSVKTDEAELGVCCNPGCTSRELQCGFNQWCCGETGSPYGDESQCLTITSTGGPMAQGGQCFDAEAPRWCTQCMDNMSCNSGYTLGFNSDPTINGGQPFQEQEFCFGIAMGLGVCTITCNPNNLEDNMCPRGWICKPYYPPCLQDADCNGLECVGEDTSNPMMPRPGKCKCGVDGVAASVCPSAFVQLDVAVAQPRCYDPSRGMGMGDMFCIASHHCEPPGLRVEPDMSTNYPAACGF